jgi:hypothetical protein
MTAPKSNFSGLYVPSRTPGKYILVGHEAQRVPDADLLTWAAWYEANASTTCRVALTEIGAVRVSTIFLALDHRHLGDGPPLLFETMTFGGERHLARERCSTWQEAEAQHAAAVARVKGAAS